MNFDAAKYVDEHVDIDKLRSTCESSLMSYWADNAEGDRTDVIVEFLVDDWHGQYMANEALKQFQVPFDKDNEWKYDLLDQVADKVSDELNKRLALTGDVYFSFAEQGGYCLFYYEDLTDCTFCEKKFPESLLDNHRQDCIERPEGTCPSCESEMEREIHIQGDGTRTVGYFCADCHFSE